MVYAVTAERAVSADLSTGHIDEEDPRILDRRGGRRRARSRGSAVVRSWGDTIVKGEVAGGAC